MGLLILREEQRAGIVRVRIMWRASRTACVSAMIVLLTLVGMLGISAWRAVFRRGPREVVLREHGSGK